MQTRACGQFAVSDQKQQNMCSSQAHTVCDVAMQALHVHASDDGVPDSFIYFESCSTQTTIILSHWHFENVQAPPRLARY